MFLAALKWFLKIESPWLEGLPIRSTMYRHLIIKYRPIEIGVSIWKSVQLGYMAESEAGSD